MLKSFAKDNFKLDVYGSMEMPYFKARDVALLLGYKYPANAIQDNVDVKDKFTVKQLCTQGIKLPKVHPQTYFINERGVRSLVVKSTLPNAKTIAQELGVDLLGSKIIRKEADSLCEIMKAFDGEIMIRQYPVLAYRVDLYFPD